MKNMTKFGVEYKNILFYYKLQEITLCYFIMLLYVMLFYFIMLCCVVLCCVILCYIILTCCFMFCIYLVLHVQCGCNTVGGGSVYLPKAKLPASLAGQSVDVLSSRNTVSQQGMTLKCYKWLVHYATAGRAY